MLPDERRPASPAPSTLRPHSRVSDVLHAFAHKMTHLSPSRDWHLLPQHEEPYISPPALDLLDEDPFASLHTPPASAAAFKTSFSASELLVASPLHSAHARRSNLRAFPSSPNLRDGNQFLQPVPESKKKKKRATTKSNPTLSSLNVLANADCMVPLHVRAVFRASRVAR
jgi:hypothetical protein